MPRQPRLDTPGSLHHVMGRGIDGLEIFNSKKDCEDFLGRLQDLCEKEALSIGEKINSHFRRVDRIVPFRKGIVLFHGDVLHVFIRNPFSC